MQDIGFDVISDLNLSPNDSFNWEGKATSLYCLVAGNVSSDSRTIVQTLAHLARFYQGVFYVPGMLEYQTNLSINERTDEIEEFLNRCQPIFNVAVLIADWGHSELLHLQRHRIFSGNAFDNLFDLCSKLYDRNLLSEYRELSGRNELFNEV
jgi:hypothetical protein